MKFRIEEKLFPICLLCYFITRIYGLTSLPIFVDEGIHIQWASEMWRGDLGGILRPLLDGKLLQIWLTALVIPWSLDPLWASRFVTVFFGSLTLWGCYEIGRILFNKTIGLVSAGLYIICPFVLFYDRMALADGILSAFSTLTLLWSISIIKEPKKEYVWLLGVSIALGILTKIFPGIVLLSTPLIVWLCLPKRKKTSLWRYFRNVYLLAIGVSLIPICIFFKKTTQIVEKSVLAPTSFDFLQNFSSNFKMASEWLWAYWTPTVMILGMIGFIMALVKKQREAILLLILVLFPIVVLGGISRIWFPRYILFVTVPFLILASWSATHLKSILEAWVMRLPWQYERWQVQITLSLIFFAIIFFPARRIDYYLWTDPSRAPLPRIERIQYIEEWPSGYGVKEAAVYLLQEAVKHPEGIMVVHHEFGDTTNSGLRVYFMKDPAIKVQRLGLNRAESFLSLLELAKNNPTFVLLSRPALSERKEDQPDIEQLLSIAKLEKRYPKPGGRRSIEVYRVESN